MHYALCTVHYKRRRCKQDEAYEHLCKECTCTYTTKKKRSTFNTAPHIRLLLLYLRRLRHYIPSRKIKHYVTHFFEVVVHYRFETGGAIT